MTLEEAKDQILNDKGLDLDYPFSDGVLLDIYKEAAELYAESLRKEIAELKSRAYYLTESWDKAYREITELKAEIERLKKDVQPRPYGPGYWPNQPEKK